MLKIKKSIKLKRKKNLWTQMDTILRIYSIIKCWLWEIYYKEHMIRPKVDLDAKDFNFTGNKQNTWLWSSKHFITKILLIFHFFVSDWSLSFSPSFVPIPSNVSLSQADFPSNWSPGHWFLSKQFEINFCWEVVEQQLKMNEL